MAFGRETPADFKGALTTAREILATRHDLVTRGVIDTEAEQIVMGAFRLAQGETLSRADFYARLGERIPEVAAEKAIVMAMGRAEGKLLQHLLGYQAFLDHDYLVSPSVLVPRPETEVLASVAIDDLAASENEPRLGLEVGLGSGVLSIELLHRFPGLRVFATEVSRPAVATAQRNSVRVLGVASAARLSAQVIEDPAQVLEPFVSLLGQGALVADFIISNPPYLARVAETDAEVDRHEPHAALYAPAADLLYFYRKIALDAPRLLKPSGTVYLELPHTRASSILGLFKQGKRPSGAGIWETKLLPDLTGRDRVLVARLIGA